jgi:hypothetical protein
MYNYLGELTVDNPILGNFEATVQQKISRRFQRAVSDRRIAYGVEVHCQG